MHTQKIGNIGENLAVDYLENREYTILQRNFRCKQGEIDIICLTATTLVFVEVKARLSNTHGQPYEAVTPLKVLKIRKTAYHYLSKLTTYYRIRIDVISLHIAPDGSLRDLKHFKNISL